MGLFMALTIYRGLKHRTLLMAVCGDETVMDGNALMTFISLINQMVMNKTQHKKCVASLSFHF